MWFDPNPKILPTMDKHVDVALLGTRREVVAREITSSILELIWF